MHAQTTAAPTRGLARLDATIILLIILLSLISLAVWYSPGFPGVEDARALDIAINVAAIMIGAAVAILAWIRWRDTGESVALYESSAFVALTAINVLMTGIVILGKESAFGLDATQPGVAPIYVWTITRGAVAVILVIGAARSLRREAPPLPPLVLAIVPGGHPRAVRDHAVRAGGDPAAGPRCGGLRPHQRPRPRGVAVLDGGRAPPGRDLRRLHRGGHPLAPALHPVRPDVRRRTSRRAWSSPRSASCISPSTLSSRRGS